jgi:hypothetical protein
VNWLEVIGWLGAALLVWSLLQTRILRLRVFNLLGCLVVTGYNAAIGVWPMVGLNGTLAIINLYYLRKLLATRHDEAAYEVVEVGTGDEFLSYLLKVHGNDIARFNPHFTWDGGAGQGRSAFLVLRGDEVVGVMLIRDTGDGVAQVELDYVTGRFRDFTPGEFVYRRSRLLTERGFRRVLSPPGMVAPYYDRVGFRRTGDPRIGDAFVLDLPDAGA